MPEITVGITTYNLEKYIRKCIQELLQQTYQSFEIIIYDDCSKDQTRSLLQEIKKEHTDRIKLILGETPLKSPALARNAILDSGMVTGKYIMFLDGDDNIETDFLESLYTAAEENQSEITLCAYDRIEERTGHILAQEMREFPKKIQIPLAEDDSVLAFINGSLWNKLILVRCIGEIRMQNFNAGEDLSFQLALFNRCNQIACVDQVLIHYRVRSSSVISNTQEETVYQFAQELQHLWVEAFNKQWLRNSLELIAFIHIGISMPLRLSNNPDIKLNHILKWINNYFKENYQWFYKNPMFRLSSLAQHGLKGLGLWAAQVCYKLHCSALFIWMYQFITDIFHIELKF